MNSTRYSVLVGIAVFAFAILITVTPSQSAAQDSIKKKKAVPLAVNRWEYKVVFASIEKPKGFAGNGNSDVAQRLTDQFNDLAKEGWELVGPVFIHGDEKGRAVEDTGGFVLFKRLAK